MKQKQRPGRKPVKVPRGLGRRLRAAREAAGLTLRELAERTGISESTLTTMEHGGDPDWVAPLTTIAAALGVTVAALAGEGDADR